MFAMRRPPRTLKLEGLETRTVLSATVMEMEPNDSQAQATPIPAIESDGVDLVGTAHGNENDFFVMTPATSGRLSVQVNSTSNGLAKLEVETANGVDVFETEPNDGIHSGSFQISAGVTYLFRMRSQDNHEDASYVTMLRMIDHTGDANGDQHVDLNDFNVVKAHFGERGRDIPGDLNDDDSVDIDDFHLVKRDFGQVVIPGDGSATSVTESEPNDDKKSADRFDLLPNQPVTLSGVSQGKDDRDFFVFTPAASGMVNLTAASPNGNIPAVEIESETLGDIFETEPDDGINSGSFAVTAGHQYFLRVRAENDSPAQYDVTIQAASAAPPASSEHASIGAAAVTRVLESEPNDRQSAADRFSLNAGPVRLLGTSQSDKDKDFFVFTPNRSGTVHVNVASSNGRIASLEVEDARGRTLFETEPKNGVNSGEFSVTQGVNYFIRLRAKDRAAAGYLVDLALADAI
jgi:hypothetical protein